MSHQCHYHGGQSNRSAAFLLSTSWWPTEHTLLRLPQGYMEAETLSNMWWRPDCLWKQPSNCIRLLCHVEDFLFFIAINPIRCRETPFQHRLQHFLTKWYFNFISFYSIAKLWWGLVNSGVLCHRYRHRFRLSPVCPLLQHLLHFDDRPLARTARIFLCIIVCEGQRSWPQTTSEVTSHPAQWAVTQCN